MANNFFKMEGSLVRTATPDGLVLYGFLVKSKRSRKILFLSIPGLGTNFYRGMIPRHFPLIKKLGAEGISYLSVNTRGHEREAKIDRVGKSSVLAGAQRELLKDSAKDLDGWVSFARQEGYKKIILCGHSLGAAKLALYLQKRKSPMFLAALYSSPPDTNYDIEGAVPPRRRDGIKLAQNMIRKGKGEELVPPGFHYFRMSAKTYLDRFLEKNKNNPFDFDKGNFGWARSLRMPQLLLYGKRSEPVKNNDTRRALKIFKKEVPAADVIFLKGADHNYVGKETEYGSAVFGWLKKKVL